MIQFGWRDGAPNGVYAYDPADDETALVSNYAYLVRGNTIEAILKGQTVALSAFQEGASDGWKVDWVESSVLTLDGGSASTIEVSDEADMADPSGDIGSIAAAVVGENLHLYMTTQGIAAPTVDQTTEGMKNPITITGCWIRTTIRRPAAPTANMRAMPPI